MIILMKLVNNKKPAGALHHLRHSLQGGEGAGLQLGEDLKTFWIKFPAKMISKRPPEDLQRKPQRLLVAEIEQSGSEEVLRIFWTFSMIFQTFWIFWKFWTFWIFWTFSTNWKNVFLNLFPFGEGEPALKPLDRDLICFRAWFPPTLSLVVLVVVLSRHCGQHPGLLLLPSRSLLQPPFCLVGGKASISSFSPLPMLMLMLIPMLPFFHKIPPSKSTCLFRQHRTRPPEFVQTEPFGESHSCFLFTNDAFL